MTREEQLLKAIEPNEGFFAHNETVKNTALKALKWADEHPNWHKYPEEKPSVSGIYRK